MSYSRTLIGISLVVAGLGSGCENDSRSPAWQESAERGSLATPSDSAASRTTSTTQASGIGPASETLDWAGDQDAPFDVSQFLVSRADRSDNAASDYVAAFAMFSSAFGDSNLIGLEDVIRKVANLDSLFAGHFSAAQVDQLLEDTRMAVHQIDVAQSKPCCIFVTARFDVEGPVPHLKAMSTLNSLSILQLHQSIVHRDFALAEAAIRRSLRASRDLQPRGHLACQLVSMAIDEALLDAIERLTLKDPQLTTEHCDRLLALLVEHQRECLDRYDEGLRTEYLTVRTTINDVQCERLSLSKLFEYSGFDIPSIPNGLRLNFEAEIASCNRLFSMAMREASKSFIDYRKQSIVRDELAKLASEARAAEAAFLRPGSCVSPIIPLLMLPAIESLREANTRSVTHLAGVQMLVALRRYELIHHELPQTLDAAAAETALETVPLDAFAGTRLRYAIVEGRPTVYSTGKDLTDDGGATDWKRGNQPGDFLFVLPTQSDANCGKSPSS